MSYLSLLIDAEICVATPPFGCFSRTELIVLFSIKVLPRSLETKNRCTLGSFSICRCVSMSSGAYENIYVRVEVLQVIDITLRTIETDIAAALRREPNLKSR